MDALNTFLAEKPWRHLAVFCQATDRSFVWFAVIRDVTVDTNDNVKYKELFGYADNTYDAAIAGLIKKVVP